MILQEIIDSLNEKEANGVCQLKKLKLTAKGYDYLKKKGITKLNLTLYRVEKSKRLDTFEYELRGRFLKLNNFPRTDLTSDKEEIKVSFRAENNDFVEGDSGAFSLLPKDYKRYLLFNFSIALIIGILIYVLLPDYIMLRFISNMEFTENIKVLFDEVLLQFLITLGGAILAVVVPHLIGKSVIDTIEEQKAFKYVFILIYFITVAILAISYLLILRGGLSFLGIFGRLLFLVLMVMGILYIAAENKSSMVLRDVFNDVSHGPVQFLLLAFISCAFSTYIIVSQRAGIRTLDDFDRIETYLAVYQQFPQKRFPENFRLALPEEVLKNAVDTFLLYEQEDDYYRLHIRLTNQTYLINTSHLNEGLIRDLKSYKSN